MVQISFSLYFRSCSMIVCSVYCTACLAVLSFPTICVKTAGSVSDGFGLYCTLTLYQSPQLMTHPVTSRWLRPATQCLPPTPAHWGQHSEWPSLRTHGLAGLVLITIIITLIVTWIKQQERPHQHRLQHLQRETIYHLQWNITTFSRYLLQYTNVLTISTTYNCIFSIVDVHVTNMVVLNLQCIILHR